MNPVTDKVIATLGKTAVDVLKEESESFLSAALGEPAKALGGLMADGINARRHSNLVKITAQAKRKLQEAGVSPKEVPLSIIHPALESASLEENDDLRSIWANLLANSSDPRAKVNVLPSFTGMLRELTSRDVKFLNLLYEKAENSDFLPWISTQSYRIQLWRGKAIRDLWGCRADEMEKHQCHFRTAI